MNKVSRLLAVCAVTLPFAASAASAQTYETIDYPGAVGTGLFGGPNPEGTAVGGYVDTAGFLHGFTLQKGVFTSFDPPGSTSTTPNFITPQGTIVGGYVDSGGVSHGFLLNDGNFTTVDFPGAAGTVLSSINPSGEISGESCVVASCASGVTHSFIVSKKGVFTSFDPPGATSSSTAVVIPSGAIFGSYTDSGGVGHGYMLSHRTFTTIDYPGAVFTFIGGANAEGDCVGEYVDTSNVGHAFLLSRGVFTSFDPPGAVPFSVGAGINPSGVIVGYFVDAANNLGGYIRTP
jgi:hypothetical protein